MNRVKQALLIYDLLRSEKGSSDQIRSLIANLVIMDQYVIARDGREIVGVAFFAQVEDALEVRPGEPVLDAKGGKYLYVQLIFVRPDRRTGGVLRSLLVSMFQKRPSAQRLAFHRESKRRVSHRRKLRPRDDKRVHVLNLAV